MSGPPDEARLVDRVVTGSEADRWRDKATTLPRLRLNARSLADLECVAVGAYSPLQGFHGAADHARVCEEMRLADGTLWPVPVTLPVADDAARDAEQAGGLALTDTHGHPLAILELEEVFVADKRLEADRVFGTEDDRHPGVRALFAAPKRCAAGRVTVFELPAHTAFTELRLTPRDTRAAFEARGWRTVVGFQTRNPVHRAHEHLHKVALELVDGLLLHPLVGETKDDDVPADVRMRAYEVLLESYYPRDRVLLSVFPAAMRYAGPREAVMHALARRNYGCSHLIVGRDHAGVGSFYGTYDAQRIFDGLDPAEVGIVILAFEHAFWCNACEGMATTRTCPHGAQDRVALSGTAVREMLTAGEAPPPEFSRPEVAQVLIDGYRKEKAG